MGKVVLIALLVAGCAPKKPIPKTTEGRAPSGRESEAVLEVGAEKLSAEEVRARLEAIRSALPGAEASDAQLAVVADFELLADEAERRGYGNDPRVVSAVKDALAAKVDETRAAGTAPHVDEAALKKALDEGRKKSRNR